MKTKLIKISLAMQKNKERTNIKKWFNYIKFFIYTHTFLNFFILRLVKLNISMISFVGIHLFIYLKSPQTAFSYT